MTKVKVTEYDHKEGSEIIDVCYTLTLPGQDPQDKVIAIYYDEFLTWSKRAGYVYSGFEVHHYNDTDRDYTLATEGAELNIEEYLKDMFGIQKPCKACSKALDKHEQNFDKFQQLLLEVKMLVGIMENNRPGSQRPEIAKIFYQANNEWAINSLKETIARYDMANTHQTTF